jgi:hypothetical protein
LEDKTKECYGPTIPRPLAYDTDDHEDNCVGMETTLSSPSAYTSPHLVSGNLKTNRDKL